MNKLTYLLFAILLCGVPTKANSDSVETVTNQIQRVRIDFQTPLGYTRHLLLGFTTDNAASDGIDYGYDALNIENFPDDLLWMIEGQEYVIQGVGAYINNKRYPFALNLENSGEIKFSLNDLENFDNTIDVFVYDSLLNTYHQINTQDYIMTLDAGNYDNRFFLTFKNDTNESLTIKDNHQKSIVMNYLVNSKEIYINYPAIQDLKRIQLISLSAQTVYTWNPKDYTIVGDLRIPAAGISEGVYIIKVLADNLSFEKKVIIGN